MQDEERGKNGNRNITIMRIKLDTNGTEIRIYREPPKVRPNKYIPNGIPCRTTKKNRKSKQ